MADWCPICGRIRFTVEKHACPPKWEVCDPNDDPEDWRSIYATDAEDAAERFCDEVDPHGDYQYASTGHADKILVRGADGQVQAFYVSAEAVVQYHASVLREEAARG